MIDSPYQNLSGGTWLRGNLHTHTTRSDGARDTQTVIDDYARRGYDFLMISDHDICTLPSDYAQFDGHGMILIAGNEITANGPHLLHVGGNRRIEPDAQRQKVIDDVAATAGFVVINHPNWERDFDHCSMKRLNEWNGYAGVEIFNGVIGRLQGDGYALDKWERLLAQNRRVWGFANDDSHIAEDVGLGWNVVYARERSLEGIIEALRAGRFYASTGVVISAIEIAEYRIRIETQNAARIVCSTLARERIAVVDAPMIEIEMPDDKPYIRFECWGQGEQFAWTQPFWNAAKRD